jgi:hypothetical protein
VSDDGLQHATTPAYCGLNKQAAAMKIRRKIAWILQPEDKLLRNKIRQMEKFKVHPRKRGQYKIL